MTRFAIGMQDFRGIREGGYEYVDKTQFIIKLIEGPKFYFLSRPRRFGKSLFLSTIENFFLGKKELFEGLTIYDYNWEWEEYPVIRIDLNGMDYTVESENALLSKLDSVISWHEAKYGLLAKRETNISIRFAELIHQLYSNFGRKVIVLVDEYEKPVLDVFGNENLMTKYREALRGFYSVLKSQEEYLQLVFITGITKFGKMSVFSGLNNLYDISLDDEYASICGITHEELLSDFEPSIVNLADKREVTPEEVISLLKSNYDGYHFSASSPDIYNPFSLLQTFAKSKISDYWAESGTPSILVKTLIESGFKFATLDESWAPESSLSSLSLDIKDPIPLLYQTGYLTIKGYDEDGGLYKLGFPNKEVEKSLLHGLLEKYSNQRETTNVFELHNLVNYINRGEPRRMMEILVALTSDVSYELVYPNEEERHFQNMFYIICRLLSLNVNVERRTSHGRIDIVIETTEYVYIIELKVDSTPEKALEQIKSKGYANPYIVSDKKIYLIGVNFSKAERAISGYEITTVPPVS